MQLSPDAIVFWRWGPVVLNATILYSWLVMALLVAGSWLVTRRLSSGLALSRPQNMLEGLVTYVRSQIREIIGQQPDLYLPFIGTIFLFISVSNLLFIVPGLRTPASSLSTTTALAVTVFAAVPMYGIRRRGLVGYLRLYAQPSVLVLPFRIVAEIARTVALAVRLFGNMMSHTMVAAIILSLAPIFVPVALGVYTE